MVECDGSKRERFNEGDQQVENFTAIFFHYISKILYRSNRKLIKMKFLLLF
jgi:hypothetical protein